MKLRNFSCGAILATLVLVGLAAFVSSARTAQNPGAAKKIASVEGITEYQLSNGVRYLLFPDQSSPKVTVNLTVFVGSRHEGYGETGMAHLLEHMLFKGSKLFPDVDKSMQQRGARFNGTTWVDRTNYFETLDASDDHLKFAIKLEADRLINSFIRREDLAKEMTVVRNEFEQGENSPENILSQRMMAVAFEWHNYGKSTIGNRSDIERVPIENLQEFYRKFYQPDNIMVVIAGRFNEANAHKYMGDYFGALKTPNRKLPNTYTEEPAQDGERNVILRRVGSVGVVGVIYHTPAAAHPDCVAVQVLESVLTSAPSGRLYKALVETKKATAVSGFAPAWHDPAILEIGATVGDKSTPEEVRDIILNVMENLQKEPITAQEVERAKLQLLAQWKRGFNRSDRIAVQLSEWAGAGDWRLMFLHRDRIKKVTAAQVNAAAGKYLLQSNRTVGLFIPIKKAEQIVRAQIPQAPNVTDLVKDYKGGKAIATGEVFDPTPQNIEERVKRMTLPGGMKIALLPKKTRGNTVVASMTLRFGNEDSLKDKTTAAAFIGAMLTRGTEKYDRQQLKDELSKLKAVLSVSSGTGTLSVSIQAEREAFPKVLDLLEQALRHPTFPAKEFDILKRANLQALRKSLKEPAPLAFTKLRRKLNPYPKDNIRYVPTIEEQMDLMEKVTLDDVKNLYRAQLGAGVGEVAIVGDFDPDIAVAKLKQAVDGWKSAVPFRRIDRIAEIKTPGGKEQILTPDKKNAMYVGGYVMRIKDTDPKYPALEIGNYILGGSGLKSLLFDRLRNKEGLCYGAGSAFNVSALDNYGLFAVVASCNPDNMKKVDDVTIEVLKNTAKKGVSTEDMEEYRKGYLRQQKLSRASDGTLASMLSEDLFLGRTMKYYAELEGKVEKMNVAEVNSALRELIQPERLVIIQAGDFRNLNKKK